MIALILIAIVIFFVVMATPKNDMAKIYNDNYSHFTTNLELESTLLQYVNNIELCCPTKYDHLQPTLYFIADSEGAIIAKLRNLTLTKLLAQELAKKHTNRIDIFKMEYGKFV